MAELTIFIWGGKVINDLSTPQRFHHFPRVPLWMVWGFCVFIPDRKLTTDPRNDPIQVELSEQWIYWGYLQEHGWLKRWLPHRKAHLSLRESCDPGDGWGTCSLCRHFHWSVSFPQFWSSLGFLFFFKKLNKYLLLLPCFELPSSFRREEITIQHWGPNINTWAFGGHFVQTTTLVIISAGFLHLVFEWPNLQAYWDPSHDFHCKYSILPVSYSSPTLSPWLQ